MLSWRTRPDPNSPLENHMNTRFEQSPRLGATDIATGLILSLMVAMAISVVVHIQPPAQTTSTHTVSAQG
jgi:hypothetical protein